MGNNMRLDYNYFSLTIFLSTYTPTLDIQNKVIFISVSGSVGKKSVCNAGDLGSIPGEGNGNPLQYFCLENSMDRGAGLQSMGSQGLTEQQTFIFTFRGRGNREHSAHNRKCLSTPFNTFKLSIYSTSHQFP